MQPPRHTVAGAHHAVGPGARVVEPLARPPGQSHRERAQLGLGRHHDVGLLEPPTAIDQRGARSVDYHVGHAGTGEQRLERPGTGEVFADEPGGAQ